MGDLQGRKVFKVFNQEFIVDERYNVTKELGQGAYGIVWYAYRRGRQHMAQSKPDANSIWQCCTEQLKRRGGRDQENHQHLQQEDSRQASA